MPIFSLSYVWVFLGALLIGSGGSWYVVDAVKDKEIANLKLTQSNKDLETAKGILYNFSSTVSRINANAQSYEDFKKTFAETNEVLKSEFANAVKASPLPPDCKPDAARMQSLTAAITSANSSKATIGR